MLKIDGSGFGRPRIRLRPGRMGATAWLALAALLLGLLLLAPASLADALVREASGGRIYLARAAGTVWSGEGTLAVAGGGPSRPVAWHLLPRELLNGRIALGLSVGGAAPATLARGLDGTLSIEGLQASLPGGLVGAALPALHRLALGGTVEVAVPALALAKGSLQGNASLRWLQAGTAYAKINPLGDYAVDLSGSGTAATLQLRTLKGALQVEANGRRGENGRMAIQGTARAADNAPELKPFLAFMGPMQGEVLPFSLQF